MRTVAEIQAEIDTFEAQFRDWPEIPAGTPFRKQLQREAIDAAHKRACLPENIKRRLALMAERQRARRSETAKTAAAVRQADPEHRERQRIFRELRKMGFRREFTSNRSAYYSRGSLQVRVSDHEVPLTAEREWNMSMGGKSWANSRRSYVVGGDMDFDEWLDDIKSDLNGNDEE